MVALLAHATRVPPPPLHILDFTIQIGSFDLRPQNLRLLGQTRHMRKPCGPAARTPAHETFLRFPVEGLRADVARLAFGVLGARLRRYHYGLRVLLIRIVLLSAAGLFYFLAEPVMAALFPVFFLAFGPAVACAAAAAFLAQR